ncbi:hypothetical protein OAS39_11085 [Pirellulales bacterium]|nr:hypothetical protein [Pirellulales bacterium]
MPVSCPANGGFIDRPEQERQRHGFSDQGKVPDGTKQTIQLMNWPNRKLRTSVAVAVVVAYFPLARIYHSWFVCRYNSYYVTSVLGRKIQNGDSLVDVAAHFHSYRLLSDQDKRDMENIANVYAGEKTEQGDEFYHFGTRRCSSIIPRFFRFSVGGGGAYLQFRGGRLVNLDNGLYGDARQLSQLRNDPVPHHVLEYGVWPFYLVFILCGIVLYLYFYRERRSEGRGSILEVA